MTPSMGVGDLDEKVVGSIANATSNVIGADSTGISKILDSIGGPSGIVLYVLVLGLYAYLVYLRWGKPSPSTLRFGSDDQTPTGADTKQHCMSIAQEQVDNTLGSIEKQGFLRTVQRRPTVRPIRASRGSESSIYAPVW